MSEIEEKIKKLLINVDKRGYLKSRESSTIEFKENFSLGNFPKYAKTMAAFANKYGGLIIFGVKDSPRVTIGLKNPKKFNETKQEKITQFLLEHFSPEIKYELGTIEVDDKIFGYLFTYPSDEKPVICKKNRDKELKSGEIYYRYRGQSKKIEYAELRKIIQEYREKERVSWMKLIEKIAQVGPKHIALVDLLNGAISTSEIKGTQLIIDKNLLDDLKEKVKFIEEGHFSDVEGEPTLKIVGEVKTTANLMVPNLDPNKDYPYLQKMMAEELQKEFPFIRPYDIQVLVWHLNLKGDKKYHLEFDTSKTTKTHKFSKYALEKLKEFLHSFKNNEKLKNELKELSRKYNRRKNKK